MQESAVTELKRRLAEQVRAKAAELSEAAKEAESAGLSVYYDHRTDTDNFMRSCDLRVSITETVSY